MDWRNNLLKIGHVPDTNTVVTVVAHARTPELRVTKLERNSEAGESEPTGLHPGFSRIIDFIAMEDTTMLIFLLPS